MSSVLAASRYGASAPPRHVSGLSNDSRDLVPRQTSYDDDSFDADSSGGMQASAAHRRRAPRGSKLSLRKRDVRGGRRSKNVNGSTAAAAADPLSKALSAAQRIQVSELKNEIESLALELEEIRKENKVLKRTVVIHEKSLGKYEDKDGDVVQLVERHNQETHALRELMKRSKDENRKLSKALHDAQEELEVTRKQLKKLQAIADNDNLAERDNLSKKLRAATDDLDKKNERIAELEKHIELLVKNHNRELNVETKRLRDVKAELDELQRKYNKLQPHAKLKEHGQALGDDASGAHTDRQPRDSSRAAAAAAAAHGGSDVSAAATAVPAASSLRSEPRLNDGVTKTRTSRAAGSSDEASDREFFLTNQTANVAHAHSGAGFRKMDPELDPSEYVSLRLSQGLDEGGRAVEERRQQPLTNAGFNQRQQQQPVRSSIFDHPNGAGVGASERRNHAAASDDATALKGHLDGRGSPLVAHQVVSANRGSLNEPSLQLSSARGTLGDEPGAAPHAHRRRPAVEPSSPVKLESFDEAADRSKHHRILHESNSTDGTLLSSSRDPFVNTAQKRLLPRHSNVLPDFMHTTEDSRWEDSVISREQQKIKPVSETLLQTTVVDDARSFRDRQRLQPAEKIDAAQEAAAAEERRKKDLLLQKMKEIDRNRGIDSSVHPDASLLRHPQPPISAEAHGSKGAGVLAGTDRLPDNDADASVSTLRPGAPERRDRLLKLLRIDASHVEATAVGKAQPSRPADESSSSSYQPTFLSSGDRQPPAADARPPRRSNIISELFGADDGKKVTAKSTFDDDDDLIGEPAGRFGQAPAGREAATRPGAKVLTDDAPLLPPSLAGGGRPRGKYAAAAPASFNSGLGGGAYNHDIDDIEVVQL